MSDEIVKSRPKSQDLYDKLQLNDSIEKINIIKSVIAKTPDTDKKKIESVKKEIKSGNYQIQSKTIASKIQETFVKEKLELA